MKFKTSFINLIIIISSVYLPMLVLSSYSILFGKSSKIVDKRLINEDLPQKLNALEKGFLPVYSPESVKEYAKETKIFPIGSLPYTSSYICNEGYGLILYKTDRFGLRNIDTNWNQIQHKSNIFVIGDSFVHGACVPEKYTITEKLKEITNLNAINLGTSANGPYEYQALLKNLVSPILSELDKNNKVILIFFGNDDIKSDKRLNKLISNSQPIVKFNLEGDALPTEQYRNTIIKLIKLNFPTAASDISKILREDKKELFEMKSIRILTLEPIRHRLGFITSFFSRTDTQYSSPSHDSIKMLANICVAKCTPYTVYIPASSFWNLGAIKYKKSIKKLSKLHGISFIDGEDVIDPNNKEDYAPKGSHLSITGYKKLAELIKLSIIN